MNDITKGVITGVLTASVIAAGTWFISGIGKIKTGFIIPEGAIIPFDRTPSAPCLIGWTVWKEATSRFIIGAGQINKILEQKYSKGSDSQRLTSKGYRQHGGSENHVIKIPEMPNHTHTFKSSPQILGGHSGVVKNKPGVGDNYTRFLI